MKPAHPIADLFPLLGEPELAILAEDIRANGLREPITLHPDGSILDGRNRDRACEIARVEPRFVEWDGKGTAKAFVVSRNLHRRHLTTSQRAMVAGRLANMQHGGDRRSDQETNLSLDAEVSVDQVAQQFGVSAQSVKNAKTVIASGDDDLIHEVEAGDMSVSNAAKRVRERDKQVDDLAPKRRKRTQKSVDARVAAAATLRQYGVLARQLYDGLDAITGLPDIETMVKATARRHAVVTAKVPIAINWLNDFADALSERNGGDGKQRGEADRLQGIEEEAQPQDRDLDAGDGDQAA